VLMLRLCFGFRCRDASQSLFGSVDILEKVLSFESVSLTREAGEGPPMETGITLGFDRILQYLSLTKSSDARMSTEPAP
jgi:hypothetical protein